MAGKINTVAGSVTPDKTGYILPHEHVVLFPSILNASDYEQVYNHFVPLYRELVEKYGCQTLVEVSPRLIANIPNTCRLPDSHRRRDFKLLKDISRDSGMNIVLCTGFYRPHTRPGYFFEWSAERLAAQMVEDLTCGIDGTDVKAGIIKVAVDDINTDSDRKLMKAAAIAQRETGAAVTTHTCTPENRMGLLNLMEGAGVDPDRIYLGHADANSDIRESMDLVKRGCHLLLTLWGIMNPQLIGWNNGTLLKHHSAYIVKALIDEGFLHQVLASVDYGVYSLIDGVMETETYENPERTPAFAFTFIVPELKRLGISQEEIDTLLLHNPRNMLAWKK